MFKVMDDKWFWFWMLWSNFVAAMLAVETYRHFR